MRNIFLTILALTFVACGKGGSDVAPQCSDISGYWGDYDADEFIVVNNDCDMGYAVPAYSCMAYGIMTDFEKTSFEVTVSHLADDCPVEAQDYIGTTLACSYSESDDVLTLDCGAGEYSYGFIEGI